MGLFAILSNSLPNYMPRNLPQPQPQLGIGRVPPYRRAKEGDCAPRGGELLPDCHLSETITFPSHVL